MIQNRSAAENVPTVAIDARLVRGTSTGDSTYWTGLIEGMAAIPNSFRIVLVSNAPRPAGIPDRFEWVHLPGQNGRLWSLVRLPMWLRQQRVDLLHLQYTASPLLRTRFVDTVHDVSFLIGPEWFQPRDRAILRSTVPSAVRRAAKIITVSETSRRDIEANIPAAVGKVAVTPLACPSWIRPVEAAVAEKRLREMGIDAPYALTVGTRWPRKNMRLATEAFARLPATVPHRLVVTGKAGWGAEELGGRGLATGYVSEEDLSILYSGASLYLAPSLYEGFGLPILEAFRCGCPVLCTGRGSFPEVAGAAAEIMDSVEPDVWARQIESLLGDSSKLERLRNDGRERERAFSWSETARRTLAAYEEAMRG